MNVPNVKKWVKALRSGKFKQAKGRLAEGERNCCLGVVCVLAGIPKDKHNAFDGERYELPTRAQTWLGIRKDSPRIGQHEAVDMNDGTSFVPHHTFEKIADEIEKHWLKRS